MSRKPIHVLLRPLGAMRYVLLAGAGSFGGWMFVVSCFWDSFRGEGLTLPRLVENLVVAVGTGILFAAASWKSSSSPKKDNESSNSV